MTVSCRCGETALEITGAPIVSVICCCESCRTAGQKFEAEGALGVLTPDGGTAYGLYRKDRVRIAAGGQHLAERRLKPDSPTRRVLATCCATPMFADFTPGHWLSVYRQRVGEAPAPQMRVMAADAPAGVTFSDGIPTYPNHPPRMMLKLIGAWAAMGFRRPKVTW